MPNRNFQSLSNFIWSVADLLRGPYRPPQYERVMLPMTVLRRFDCVLEHSKAQILAKHEAMVAKNKTLPPAKRINDFDPTLNKLAKDIDGRELGFHNHSPLNFQKLKDDPDNVGRHLQDYINGFSRNIREIFDKFEFDKEIEKMEDSNRLYLVVSKFAEIDLHPERVNNITICDPIEETANPYNFSVALRLMALRGYIQAACTAVRERAPRIRFSHVANMFPPLPPRAEQDEIVRFISNNRDSTSALESALRDSIAHLKERRSALIAAAVTGRLTVSV